jgi:transcriptional regulator with XRE-family HTH domain
MTRGELVELLQRKVQRAGTQAALAKELGITAAYLGDVLHGKREPGPKLLNALGFRRVITSSRTAKNKRASCRPTNAPS